VTIAVAMPLKIVFFIETAPLYKIVFVTYSLSQIWPKENKKITPLQKYSGVTNG